MGHRQGESPTVFNPTALDARQWAKALKSAGMTMAVLTVKHHEGFCLWQTRYTEQSVKNSPWKDGKGDMVREFVDAVRAEGMEVGIYLSPADLFQIESPVGYYGDGNAYVDTVIPTDPASFNSNPTQTRETPAQGLGANVTFACKADSYNRYFLNQLYELLTEYGPVAEVWFDGATPKTRGGQKYAYAAWYGTFVTTPQVSKESATVNVKNEVVNDSDAAKSVTVKTYVEDANASIVAQMESTQTIAARATGVFDQTSEPVANTNLWSPEHPNLYSVKTVVLDGDNPVDDYTSPLCFRWFKFTADQGFFLNGEHLYFKGANVHQDHAGWGGAVADSGFFRDVKMMKDVGFDFIRGSHYPHAPAFSKACDELGMLFMSENCFWDKTPLKEIQTVHDPGKPLDGLTKAKCNQTIKSICQKLMENN